MNYTYTLPSETGYNVSQGIDKFFAWIVFEQPSFINYFFIMIWAIIFMGGTFIERKSIAREQFVKWGFIASFITFGLSILTTLTTDLNAFVPSIITGAVVVVFGIIWFAKGKVIDL